MHAEDLWTNAQALQHDTEEAESGVQNGALDQHGLYRQVMHADNLIIDTQALQHQEDKEAEGSVHAGAPLLSQSGTIQSGVSIRRKHKQLAKKPHSDAEAGVRMENFTKEQVCLVNTVSFVFYMYICMYYLLDLDKSTTMNFRHM
jgi:hypothetical protein